jgi:hypothetical protein
MENRDDRRKRVDLNDHGGDGGPNMPASPIDYLDQTHRMAFETCCYTMWCISGCSAARGELGLGA